MNSIILPAIQMQCTFLRRDEQNDDRDGAQASETEEEGRKDGVKWGIVQKGVHIGNHPENFTFSRASRLCKIYRSLIWNARSPVKNSERALRN